jgi:hypothetical protein
LRKVLLPAPEGPKGGAGEQGRKDTCERLEPNWEGRRRKSKIGREERGDESGKRYREMETKIMRKGKNEGQRGRDARDYWGSWARERGRGDHSFRKRDSGDKGVVVERGIIATGRVAASERL